MTPGTIDTLSISVHSRDLGFCSADLRGLADFAAAVRMPRKRQQRHLRHRRHIYHALGCVRDSDPVVTHHVTAEHVRPSPSTMATPCQQGGL